MTNIDKRTEVLENRLRRLINYYSTRGKRQKAIVFERIDLLASEYYGLTGRMYFNKYKGGRQNG